MRIGIIVPGGMHVDEPIPALISLVSHLSRKHQVFVICLAGQPETFALANAEVRVISGSKLFSKKATLVSKMMKSFLWFREKNLDVIHGFWASHPGFIAGSLGRMLSVPTVVSVGGGELIWRPEISYGGAYSLRRRLISRSALALADHITVGSQLVQEQVAEQTSVIPLGAELRANSDSRGQPTDIFRVLHVANIQPVKGPEIMVRVIEKILSERDDVVFDWVGVDTMNGQVQPLLSQYGQRVQVHGKLPHSELLTLFDDAHVYVHTSHYESQCVALCEAAASGVPIVSTSVGIANTIDGAITHNIGDADGISSSVGLLLDDRSKAMNLSIKVYQWAQKYNAEWTTTEFERIYAGVLKGA